MWNGCSGVLVTAGGCVRPPISSVIADPLPSRRRRDDDAVTIDAT